jgi:hypothetical protein
MAFDLISPLPREECVQRLKMKTDPAWSDAVAGSVGENSFRLRKRILYRNSFQASLSGRLIDDQGQTRLHCSVGLHPFVTVFLFVWIGIVSVACCVMIVSLLSGATPAKQWPAAAVPLLMLAFGVGLLKVGQFIARGEADFLKDFLQRTLDARESPGAGGWAARPAADRRDRE